MGNITFDECKIGGSVVFLCLELRSSVWDEG